MPTHLIDTAIAFSILNNVKNFKQDGGKSEILPPLKKGVVLFDFHIPQTIGDSPL
jgi:hypothetical protein